MGSALTWSPRVSRQCLALVGIVMLTSYFAAMGWDGPEFARFALGVTALWGPGAALSYVLLRGALDDSVGRLTLSAIASYALTTLAYFGLARVGLEPVFYATLGALGVTGAVYTYRQRSHLGPGWRPRAWQHTDGILLLLIACTLILNIPYKTAYTTSTDTGVRNYVLFRDHLYHSGLAYELARHVPPQQATVRGGTPERAYHVFPHVTTMLLARFTRQPDMLRVHLVYHYTVIEVLMCLVLYSIARTLTGSRAAGQLAVAFMYIVALP